MDYALDSNPHKQGLLLPGVDIPIYGPDRAAETHPDYVLILPWNIRDEVMKQMAHVRGWGGQFVVPAPELAGPRLSAERPGARASPPVKLAVDLRGRPAGGAAA